MLEQDIIAVTYSFNQLREVVQDTDGKLSATEFLKQVTKATSESAKTAHTELLQAEGALIATIESLVFSTALEATANLVLECKVLRDEACAMTLKWAVYTLMQHPRSPKILGALEKLNNEHLEGKSESELAMYPQDFVMQLQKHLGAQSAEIPAGEPVAKKARSGKAAQASEQAEDVAAARPPPKKKQESSER